MTKKDQIDLKRKRIDAEEDKSYKQLISPELRRLANNFLNNSVYANNLLDIINKFRDCLSKHVDCTSEYNTSSNDLQNQTISSILTIEVVFEVLLKRRDMHESVSKLKNKEEFTNSEHSEVTQKEILSKYRQWLRECYEESLELLLNAVELSDNKCISQQALNTYMKLLQSEGKYQFYDQISSKEDSKSICNLNVNKNDDLKENLVAKDFPVIRLKHLFQRFASGQKLQAAVISHFRTEYLKYFDILWHSWYVLQLPLLISQISVENELTVLNVLDLIDSLPILTKPKEITDSYFCCKMVTTTATDTEKQNKIKQIVTFVNIIWDNVMSWLDGGNLSSKVHQQLLLVLIKRIMEHLKQPVKLTDFLMNSLNIGGVISVLALQGVFNLMQQQNITYPQIYTKLYNLFIPDIFHMRCKSRLYRLADIFLSSTHLSESLVASFVKRFSRLCLVSPSSDIIILGQFMQNLIIRHPRLKKLMGIRNIESEAENNDQDPAQSDPFDDNEIDPSKTNALNSYLWEMALLQNHAIPTVAAMAKRFVVGNLPKHEWDLSKIYHLDEKQLFQEEIPRQYAQIQFTANTMYGLQDPRNNIQKHWDLC